MKRVISCLIIAIWILSMAGCTVISDSSEQTANEYTPQINPVEDAAADQMTVKLYFRYGDEYLLAAETRTIDVPVNERIESVIIKELIEGPSAERTELTDVIDPGTEVINVTAEGGFLFVTLSGQFIDDGTPAADADDPDAIAAQKEDRRIAVYAIVNTLIELGGFSRVQIMIDEDGNGTGNRITAEDAGLRERAARCWIPWGVTGISY